MFTLTFVSSQSDGKLAKLFPLAICACFATVILTSASATLVQANFIDPYVYAGYINDYLGTFNRFGQTYYSSRIAFIFLDHAFIAAFGQTAGPFLCRLVMLTAAALSAFSIARKYFNVETAILAIAWLCFIPWLLRSLSWMYCDGFAVVYILIGLAFLLVPVKWRHLSHFGAGFAFALAVNCNLIVLFVVGLLGPSWLILNRGERILTLLLMALSLITGFLLGYALLQLAFSLRIGNFSLFLEAVAFGTASGLLGGGATAWFASVSEVISSGAIFFLIPIVIFASTALTALVYFRFLSRLQRDFSIAAILYQTLMLATTFTLHYVFHHGFLSLFFYVVYFLPSCLLGLIVIGGVVSIRLPKSMPWIVVTVALSLLCLWFLRASFASIVSGDTWKWFSAWIAFGLVMLSLSLVKRQVLLAPSMLAVLLVTTYGILQWQPGTSRFYAIWPRQPERRALERDVYRGALFLQDFIKSRVPANTPIGFWYGNKREDRTFNAVQSMFLWGYTRVHAFDGPAMPQVDDSFRKRVNEKAYIALLARSDAGIDEGIAALKSLPINYFEVARAHFPAPSESYSVALGELYPIPSQLGHLRRLDLNTLTPTAGSIASVTSDGIKLTTAPCLWCYVFRTMVPSASAEVGGGLPVTVRVQLMVSSGRIGVAVTNAADPNEILTRASLFPLTLSQTVDLKVSHSANVGDIVFINENALGASQAVIQSIDYLATE